MRRLQVVLQKAVNEKDVYQLTDDEQDEFIQELREHMTRELYSRVKDARPLGGELGYQVRGPLNDPLQGIIHVHTLAAWFDVDTMAPDAPARLDWLATLTQDGTDAGPAGGGGLT